MAYVSQEMKKSLAPTIKAILKKYGIKGTLSVHNHSTLVLNIKSGKIDFIKNHLAATEAVRSGRPEFYVTEKSMCGYMQINTYHTDSQFSGKAKKFLAELIAAMKGPKFFDHSDSMTDYFHCSHYIDINVGKWNTPYILEK